MIYTPTPLRDAYVVEPQPISDERGLFTYLFDSKEAAEFGLTRPLAQIKLSFNYKKGTTRGMHYQCAPNVETKWVRCTRGAIVDIIVDMRPQSETYLHHFSIELTPENRRAIFVPPMFAHGYQTLVDDTEVVYYVDEFYAPSCERGLRHDDPLLALPWPMKATTLSPRDGNWTLLDVGVAR